MIFVSRVNSLNILESCHPAEEFSRWQSMFERAFIHVLDKKKGIYECCFGDKTAKGYLTSGRGSESLVVWSLCQLWTDAMTGLPNKEAFESRLNQTISRCKREGSHGGLIFFDLDGFKRVNDTAGHDAGDDVLKIVTERLKRRLRGADELFRWGGDEFAVIIYPVEDSSALDNVSDKIRSVFEDSFVLYSSKRQKKMEFTLGVSLGSLVFDGSRLAPAVIHEADKKMYQNKKQNNVRRRI